MRCPVEVSIGGRDWCLPVLLGIGEHVVKTFDCFPASGGEIHVTLSILGRVPGHLGGLGRDAECVKPMRLFVDGIKARFASVVEGL